MMNSKVSKTTKVTNDHGKTIKKCSKSHKPVDSTKKFINGNFIWQNFNRVYKQYNKYIGFGLETVM